MGPARLQTLLSTFKTAIGAHSAPFAFLGSLPGFSRAVASALKAMPLETGRKTAEAARSLGADLLLPSDAEYPALLRNIPDPPPVLFALGNPTLLLRAAAAIVGSRDHSSYGAGVCRALSAAAAECGIVIVSGMARGLDAVAHTAALDAAGGTIGVLGNGLGVVYPAANRALYDRVAAHGLLLSEFPPGERPQRRQLSPPEPAHQRPVAGHRRGRSRGGLGRPDHRGRRTRSGQGSHGGPGKHHERGVRRQQPADTGRRRRRCSSRPICCSTFRSWPRCRPEPPWHRPDRYPKRCCRKSASWPGCSGRMPYIPMSWR